MTIVDDIFDVNVRMNSQRSWRYMINLLIVNEKPNTVFTLPFFTSEFGN